MAELSDFLRSRRARLQPEDVGLPDHGRRRVPGLRREELAQLAGVSVDYYVRLEQGRNIHPSDSVLDAIATALRLSHDERAHLYSLVRPAKRPRRRAPERVRPGIQQLLDAMQVPAFVTGRRMDVLAHNELMAAVMGGFGERNLLRVVFLEDSSRELYDDWEKVAAETVSFLRIVGDPEDADLAALVGELALHSEPFRQLWARHDVHSKAGGVKRVNHPLVGPLEFDYETLKLPEPDQYLTTYTAKPGSATATALALLGSLGGKQDRGAVVMTIVCSACADGEPSSVRTVQPSSATYTSPRPAAMIGSTVITRPSVSSGPFQAMFGTSGSSWMRRPMPWPVSSAQTLKPRRSTSDCTAAPIAPTLLPAVAALSPRRSADWAAAARRCSRARTRPTGTVRQASA